MNKIELIPIDKFFNQNILYRDNYGEINLDLQLLKEYDLYTYNNFLNDSRNFLDNLKTSLSRDFNINSFKLKNFEDIHPISHLRVEHIDQLVNVRGMITKTTKVIAIVIKQKFECKLCGDVINIDGPNYPSRCSCGRKGVSSFHLMEQTLQDIQEIELEELQDELDGKQPHKIRVRLLDKLTDKDLSGILQPGNKVSILGFVEKIKTNCKDETMFEYRVNAIELIPLDEQFNEEKLNEEDLKEVNEISVNNPLEKLSKSLAPSIFGYEDIKKTLILQMVGGVKKKKSKGNYSRERIHILLCGDPGLSKSRLAKNVNLRMPKSYYISGDETSKAGLVAIVDRDPLLNNWSLKAGALSKANNSILIIDEMDKLGEEDRSALHTPMESGEIIVNKADIHTKLKAECSILGIANPKYGLFELTGSKTITQQIDLPAPLMSRFDIIFVMTDEIDEVADNSIADAIYNQEEEFSEIDISLFRKYISYAKKFKPKLKKEGLRELASFYHEIRKKSISPHSNMKGMPINPRHLEGIIRLAEASAKIRLSNFVDKEDFDLAKDLFLKTLLKLGLDIQEGTIDIARFSGGRTLSKKKKAKLIIEILKDFLQKNKLDSIDDNNLKQLCVENGIESYECDELIEEIHKEGELIYTRDGWRVPGYSFGKEKD